MALLYLVKFYPRQDERFCKLFRNLHATVSSCADFHARISLKQHIYAIFFISRLFEQYYKDVHTDLVLRLNDRSPSYNCDSYNREPTARILFISTGNPEP